MDNEALASRPESPKKKIKSNPAADSEAEPSNSSGNIDVDIFVSSLIMLLFLIISCSHFFFRKAIHRIILSTFQNMHINFFPCCVYLVDILHVLVFEKLSSVLKCL